jgi:predicted metal-dependent hydrolase
MLGEAYVRRCYNRFRRVYFPDTILPDFDELDFEFEEAPGEWGSVEWDSDGNPSLVLHPATRLSGPALKATLLHEVIHIRLGRRYGHGTRFWEEVRRIHSLGAYREYF